MSDRTDVLNGLNELDDAELEAELDRLMIEEKLEANFPAEDVVAARDAIKKEMREKKYVHAPTDATITHALIGAAMAGIDGRRSCEIGEEIIPAM